MKTKQAILFVLKRHSLSQYALAQRIGATPQSVNQWLKKTRMSKVFAEKFYKEFKVIVTDAV